MRTWRLREAKTSFSVLIEAAVTGDPRVILKRGVETAVVLSYAEYQRLVVGPTGSCQLSSVPRRGAARSAP